MFDYIGSSKFLEDAGQLFDVVVSGVVFTTVSPSGEQRQTTPPL